MPGELLVTEMVMLTHHLISLTMLIRMHWMHRDMRKRNSSGPHFSGSRQQKLIVVLSHEINEKGIAISIFNYIYS